MTAGYRCLRCGKSDDQPAGPGCRNPTWHDQPNLLEITELPTPASPAPPDPPRWAGLEMSRDEILAEHERRLASGDLPAAGSA